MGLAKNIKAGIHKFSSLIPIYGFRGTCKILIRNIFLVETMCRMEMDPSGTLTPVEPKIPIHIQICGKDSNLDDWKGKEAIIGIRGEFGLVQFRRRLDTGMLCFSAYSGEKFVGFGWLEMPPVTEAGYALNHDEAYTFDLFTFENYRGNKVLPVILQTIIRYLKNNHPGIRNLVAHISTWNHSSIKGFQAAGFKIRSFDRIFIFLGAHKKTRLNKSSFKGLCTEP